MRKIPTPKLHKTGQAFVRWQNKSKYFGRYGTSEADAKYRLWVASIYNNKAPEIKSPLVIDLFARYTREHPSKNLQHKLSAIANLGPLAGHHCHEYSPLVYRKHRERVASTGSRCARHVNDLMRLVQRVFRWGVSMEMVPLEVYTKLKTVDPLKPHEVSKQAVKRLPAKREDVMRTIDELSMVPASIVKLILYTGARPGEICSMKASEIDKKGPGGTWVFRPGMHKTGHLGKRRFIVFGPNGRSLLERLWPTVGQHFFPSSLVIGHYKPSSLRQAVGHACRRAGVAHFTPYQLRHLRLTELAVDKGLETAAAVAGHSEQSTTRLYLHEPDNAALNRAV